MNRTRVCPKCGSAEILIVDGAYASGNNIMLGASIFSAVPVDRYICCECGFTEEWIRPEDIERVKKSKKAYQ